MSPRLVGAAVALAIIIVAAWLYASRGAETAPPRIEVPPPAKSPVVNAIEPPPAPPGSMEAAPPAPLTFPSSTDAGT